jgi:hypothetical protein
MALIGSFLPAIAAGEAILGDAPPWVHAIVRPDAMTAICGRRAPEGWAARSLRPIHDWSRVSCPYCLAVVNQPT